MNETAELQPTKCITAVEVQEVYQALVASKKCGKGKLCLRDSCQYCGPLNALIDAKGDECLTRGCTLRRCVYDD